MEARDLSVLAVSRDKITIVTELVFANFPFLFTKSCFEVLLVTGG